MVRVLSVVLAVVVAVGVTGTAWAKPGKAKQAGQGAKKLTPAERFKRLDKDADGKLTKAEFVGHPKKPEARAQKEKQFAKLDRNADGVLTPEEMKPAKAPKAGKAPHKPKKPKAHKQ